MIEKRKIGKRTVELTNLDRVLFPKTGITKRELVGYYERIAPHMIQYLYNRPITMHRFVDGVGKEGFYQKNAADYFPEWVKTVPIEKQDDGTVHYVVCNDAATLVYLANQLTVTFHIWLSRIDKLNFPDKMIFDLDPSVKGFAAVRTAARQLKTVLEDELGLTTFIMTTGSRGVHIMVPLDRKSSFDTVREFARDVANLMALRYPKTMTVEMRKANRGKRIFIDYLRNAFAQTGVAPYAVRATAKASVATPIEWSELGRIQPDSFTIKNIFTRLAKKKCPWREAHTSLCSIKRAQKRVAALLAEFEQG